MKNNIRSKGRIWKRRSKNLISGEIQCPRCGEWKKVPKFTDKHFTEEYTCRGCKKELNEEQPKPPPKKKKPKEKKFKPRWPDNCPHKAFFWCKSPRECVGCYYNPEKKVALMTTGDDDPKKTAKKDWFYGQTKKQVEERLQTLEDIKHGKGLFKGGARCRFKHARKSEEDED